MADTIFMEYLLRYAPKDRVFKSRNDPFDDLTEEEFRKRFRLSKTAVSLVLKQVSAKRHYGGRMFTSLFTLTRTCYR